MADTPAKQAAAGVLDDVLADEGDVIAAHQAQDAEIFGTPAPVVAEPFFPTEQANEATDEVEQPQDDLEIPQINWETPEELREVLEAPDFDEDDDEPVAAEETYQPSDEYEDEEKAALRKQLAKAQKKLEWAEEQKAKASRKAWADEARKYFQFSNPDLIEAKSRRQFLKQAQAQHEAVARVAKPVFDQLAELKEKAKAEALAEARAEAAQRWGSPISGPGAGQTIQDTQTMQRQRLQAGQGLANVIKDKFKRGEVNI